MVAVNCHRVEAAFDVVASGSRVRGQTRLRKNETPSGWYRTAFVPPEFRRPGNRLRLTQHKSAA
jgi:hypothetical protein